MTRRKSKKDSADISGRRRKLLGILLALLAVLIFISLISHAVWDDNHIKTFENPYDIDFRNQVGIIGAFTSYLLYFLFGWLSLFLPFILILPALKLFDLSWRSHPNRWVWTAFAIGALVTSIANVLLSGNTGTADLTSMSGGGYIFFHLADFLVKIIGQSGSVILLGGGIIVSLVILGYFYPDLRKRLIRLPEIKWGRLGQVLGYWPGKLKDLVLTAFRRETSDENAFDDSLPEAETEAVEPEIEKPDEQVTYDDDKETSAKPKAGKIKLKRSVTTVGRETKDYNFPGLELLNPNPDSGPAVDPEELNFTARSLKETLETFNVKIEGGIEKYPGPIITRFEFKPAAGVKVNQIINLGDDLALALQAKRIRIVAPIPGKAAVGIEIPNRKPQMVYIKDIVASELYTDSRLKLPLAIGKSISGKPIVTDLAKMPHLLVAGATGSGKSVCINAIITSLLYRLHPDELKFIFIDPKMLELSVYAGIPHLGRPVVTNAKRAEKVLSDAVIEMEKRYKTLAGKSVRSISEYNSRLDKSEEKMPYIVIIVDELADMMMAASSTRIEMLITRLAQMARAVGIHLILATQRPSVDVITGLIKANFSARLAFQVATKVDSRTIIDGNGAEKLLGNGDMLFLQPGQPEAIRLHGPYISGEETERIVSFIKEQFPTIEKTATTEGSPDDMATKAENIDLDDPLFIEAAQTVIRHKQGSVSLLQRKLGIGYQRAARLIDNLEEAGIVGGYDGSKARDVLVEANYLEELLASRSLTRPNSQ